MRLFIERAGAVKRDFNLTDENATAVAELCRRLDGLPLAIELLAARVRTLSPQAMLTRAEGPLGLLTGGARDLPARQQTLRATLDWSHVLLDTNEQALFARLAVFVGGWTLDAAEAIAKVGGRGIGLERTGTEGGGPGHPSSSLDALEGLLAKNLLRSVESGVERSDHHLASGGTPALDAWRPAPAAPPRFGMLETIREYALERLEATGEGEAVRRAHLEHYLALAEAAEPELEGADQASWLERLEAELGNLRAALGWSLAHGQGALALRLAGALSVYWYIQAHLHEGRRWLEAALAQHGALPASARAKALLGLGALVAVQGDWTGAAASFEQSLVLYRDLEDVGGIALVLNNLGQVALEQGAYDRAAAILNESVALCRQARDASSLTCALESLGALALADGDVARAATLLNESLAVARDKGNKRRILEAAFGLGLATLGLGDSGQAASLFGACLTLSEELRSKEGFIRHLEGQAEVAWAQGQLARAARLWGAAAASRQAMGATPLPGYRAYFARHQVAAQERLGEAAFVAAWEDGATMSLEEAIANSGETGASG